MKEVLPTPARRVIFLEQENAVHDGRRLEPAGEAPSFRDYWQLVRKHQWKILVCFALAVIMSGVIAFITTPIYVAKATLMIERKAPQVVKIQQVVGETEEGDESSFYESQYQILKSRSLAVEVIKAQKLDRDATFIKQNDGIFSIGKVLSIPFAWFDTLLSQVAPTSTTPTPSSRKL